MQQGKQALRRNLRAWVVAGIVVVDVFVVLLNAQMLMRSRADDKRRAEVATQTVAAAVDQRISATIARVDLFLRTLVDELEHERAGGKRNSARLAAFLDRRSRMVPEIQSVTIADVDDAGAYGTTGDQLQISKPHVDRGAGTGALIRGGSARKLESFFLCEQHLFTPRRR